MFRLRAWQNPSGSCAMRIDFQALFHWRKCTEFWRSHAASGAATSARKKTVCRQCGRAWRSYYDRRPWVVRALSCGPLRIFLEFEIRRVACDQCGVKREKLSWLADCPFASSPKHVGDFPRFLTGELGRTGDPRLHLLTPPVDSHRPAKHRRALLESTLPRDNWTERRRNKTVSQLRGGSGQR